jgi:hypothetical protein
MRPLGRKPFKNPSKIDFHPPKGWINWWEAEVNDESGNKAREKEKVKKEIKEELKEDKI